MNTTVRVLTTEDVLTLWTMLMHAAHETSVEDVKSSPALAWYVQDWGQVGDMGVVAQQSIDGRMNVLGAAWLRLCRQDTAVPCGYGYVAKEIPELAIAVLGEHRGQGIGTVLLTHLIELAQTQFPGISLSTRSNNPAVRLYGRFGFVRVAGTEIVNRTGSTSYSMVKRFS